MAHHSLYFPRLPLVSGQLQSLWRHRLRATALSAALSALLGLAVAQALPRGPATAVATLTVMVTSLVVGFIAGLTVRSRWVAVPIILTHILAVEIGRLDVAGPTVNGLRLNEPFGILALALGRGFHGLVGLLPMVIGVFWGVVMAMRLGGRAPGRFPKKRLIITTLAMVLLAELIALPASNPSIVNADGSPRPNSIAGLEKVRLGGKDQWLMLRGYHTDSPVVLYLSGGPGQSDLPFSRVMFDDLAQHFVVVSWDQRGTGKSYASLDPTATLTLEQAVSDTVELTRYLCQRFGEEKIYLLGESWGTTLGVLAVQQHPELYHAWIGSGQMVSQRETDRRIYRDLLTLAAAEKDGALAAKLRAYGEPPYRDTPYANAFIFSQYGRLYRPYSPPCSYLQRGSDANLGPWGIWGQEYSLVEKVNVLRGLIDMFSILYPQLQTVDFRDTVQRLEIPVYILDGKAELAARRDLALEWFEQLEAPQKQWLSFENAAHSVAFEQFEALAKLMVDTVLPETYPTR